MSSEYNYRPNGEIQGDTQDLPEGSNVECGYDYGTSMPGAGPGSLKKGYSDRSSIGSDTQSDKGFA